MRNWYNHRPDPVKDRKSVEDFLAWRFPEQTRLDNCRKQLAIISGERRELERRGLRQGLANLMWEVVQLLAEIERLETSLGIRQNLQR